MLGKIVGMHAMDNKESVTGVVMMDIVVNKDFMIQEMDVMAHLVELAFMHVHFCQVVLMFTITLLHTNSGRYSLVV